MLTNRFFVGKILPFHQGSAAMLQHFTKFLRDAATRFNRIARSLRGQIKPGDLHADAWMIAAEIAEKRGRNIDFSNPSDQELVMNRIFWNVKNQRDWRLASAFSIDCEQEGRTSWADRLAAPSSSAPLEILLQREASAATDAIVAASYSQAKAYNVALDNFKNDRPRLCAHLLVTVRTLDLRMNSAYEIVRRQHSLFNGCQVIASDFTPLAGQLRVAMIAAHLEAEQAELF